MGRTDGQSYNVQDQVVRKFRDVAGEYAGYLYEFFGAQVTELNVHLGSEKNPFPTVQVTFQKTLGLTPYEH